MEKLEWVPVLYNGIETNVEVTKYGNVRKIRVDWETRKTKIGQIDFSNSALSFGYQRFSIKLKNGMLKNIATHQLVASAFLGYEFNGHKLVVDHIDSNKENNNVNNLRVITNRENCSRERTTKTGLPTGVILNKTYNKYVGQIQINGKTTYLGFFNTIEEASNAYQNKLKSLSV